jgi:hemerythrin
MCDNAESKIYVNHVLVEHRRLHSMLHKARRAIEQTSGPDRDVTLQQVAAILRQVRNELAHHFAEEEAGGCLEEAVSRCPRLATALKEIEREHPALLTEVDRLIAMAEDGPADLQHRIMIEREFDELCTQLHAHEAAEYAVLRDGFGVANGDELVPVPFAEF